MHGKSNHPKDGQHMQTINWKQWFWCGQCTWWILSHLTIDHQDAQPKNEMNPQVNLGGNEMGGTSGLLSTSMLSKVLGFWPNMLLDVVDPQAKPMSNIGLGTTTRRTCTRNHYANCQKSSTCSQGSCYRCGLYHYYYQQCHLCLLLIWLKKKTACSRNNKYKCWITISWTPQSPRWTTTTDWHNGEEAVIKTTKETYRYLLKSEMALIMMIKAPHVWLCWIWMPSLTKRYIICIMSYWIYKLLQ